QAVAAAAVRRHATARKRLNLSETSKGSDCGFWYALHRHCAACGPFAPQWTQRGHLRSARVQSASRLRRDCGALATKYRIFLSTCGALLRDFMSDGLGRAREGLEAWAGTAYCTYGRIVRSGMEPEGHAQCARRACIVALVCGTVG